MNAPSKTSPEARYLILLRHAKSAWPVDVADHERPLAQRGQDAAPRIGAYMARERLVPDLVLVSTARRAQETWRLVAESLRPPAAKRDAPELYDAPAARMAGILLTLEPAVRTVMLVGHNPGFHQLATGLVGKGDPDARRRMSEKFSTGGLAVIAFTADHWKDITPGSGQLDRFVTPRMLT